MDFGVSSIILESAKNKNRSALKTMYKAKRELAKLRFSSVFRSNFRMQRDVLLTLDSLVAKNLKELKKDRTNLEYLSDLIDSDSLKGDYIFDENKYELVGEMTRNTFRLGQKIKIYIADADKVTRTVDFLLADDVEWT